MSAKSAKCIGFSAVAALPQLAVVPNQPAQIGNGHLKADIAVARVGCDKRNSRKIADDLPKYFPGSKPDEFFQTHAS